MRVCRGGLYLIVEDFVCQKLGQEVFTAIKRGTTRPCCQGTTYTLDASRDDVMWFTLHAQVVRQRTHERTLAGLSSSRPDMLRQRSAVNRASVVLWRGALATDRV